MKPDDEMVRRFRAKDIPYRLQAIDGLAWFCNRLRLGRMGEPLEVRVQAVPIPPEVFLNGVFEMGLGSLRAVAEFLGFKVNRRGNQLIKADRNGHPDSDDAKIEDFGAVAITREVAINAGAAPPEATENALIFALRMSNKAVAHLTYGPTGAKATEIEQLMLACESVRRLTVQHLYGGDASIANAHRYPAWQAEILGILADDPRPVGGEPGASTPSP